MRSFVGSFALRAFVLAAALYVAVQVVLFVGAVALGVFFGVAGGRHG